GRARLMGLSGTSWLWHEAQVSFLYQPACACWMSLSALAEAVRSSASPTAPTGASGRVAAWATFCGVAVSDFCWSPKKIRAVEKPRSRSFFTRHLRIESRQEERVGRMSSTGRAASPVLLHGQAVGRGGDAARIDDANFMRAGGERHGLCDQHAGVKT